MAKKPVPFEDQLVLLEKQAARDRAAMLGEVLSYAETDLLCYRAEQPKLHEQQRLLFDPMLNALHDAFRIECRVTRSVMPIEQPPAMMEIVEGLYAEATDRELAALYALVPMLGSALLGLGVWKGVIPLADALAAAHLDESFQAEEWAEDEAEKAAWEEKRKDMQKCAFLLTGKPR